jgi:hypothetical protein
MAVLIALAFCVGSRNDIIRVHACLESWDSKVWYMYIRKCRILGAQSINSGNVCQSVFPCHAKKKTCLSYRFRNPRSGVEQAPTSLELELPNSRILPFREGIANNAFDASIYCGAQPLHASISRLDSNTARFEVCASSLELLSYLSALERKKKRG